MPMLQRRKILKCGGSSVIALPKGWLRYNELDLGDEVELVIDQGVTIQRLNEPDDSQKRKPPK